MDIKFLIPSQIANEYFQFCLGVLHKYTSMSILRRDLQDLTRLSSVDSLKNPDAFAESKELTEFLGSDLDFDWDLVKRAHCRDL